MTVFSSKVTAQSVGLHFPAGMVIFLHMKCKSCMLWRIVHSVYKFRYSILAFGHSLWVHQRGLFSVNTAGVWYLRGRYKPTWKPYRSTDTPMYAGVCVYASRRDDESARSIACKNMYFQVHVCVSIIAMGCAACQCGCVFIWVMPVPLGRSTERGSETGLNSTSDAPQLPTEWEHVDVRGHTWWCLLLLEWQKC